ncbi:4'-phosphopantetheinyl transferase superfamily protein [Corynebacterium pseudodiphtheriticum]|uniref:4'-phosphopantetheinyl transferase family protein n=1 Tax=Corynebacterium pseudodiphtheriticum TaxID=37637 RepID=UPI00234CF144|nr:4'-phosphopantetheinyl transferase superfamily protein [Corynebacterium pseudodiphtheriticum]MDC7111979.1 4'-phosphopantetheinyl transferase superfamily protein [Corynebacterium pseudodiphtheriticum]
MTRNYEFLLPDSARIVTVRSDAAGDLSNFHRLHPLEQSLVSHSVEKRKAEFGDARWCAHQALRQLGYSRNEPILRGNRGMPLWPEGFCGSMSHTSGMRAAAVAPIHRLHSLGIDIEPAEKLPVDIVDLILRGSEKPQISRFRATGISCADRIIFCAKETVYKTWFPMTQRWLGFEQAEIDLREDGTFVAYLLVRPTPVPLITGKWMIDDGFVFTAAAVTESSLRT